MRAAALLLMMAASLLLFPSASAQFAQPVAMEIKAEAPQERLMPETGRADVPIRVSFTCPGPLPTTSSFVIDFKLKVMPPYASVVLNPASRSVSVSPEQCLQGPRVTVETVAIIVTSREAPAFHDGPYAVEARMQSQGITGPQYHGSAEVRFTIKNDYVPQTVLSPVYLFQEVPKGGKVVFPIEVQNAGNGPTRVKIEILQTSKYKLDSINPGAEVRLESRAAKGAQAVYKAARQIDAVAPEHAGLATFAAKFTSQFDGAADGLLLTDEQVVVFSVHVLGTSAADDANQLNDDEVESVPAMPLFGTLAALGLAAWRRRA